MPETARSPQILWDSGTAYDLFASLLVIHSPAEYGLRASWAAGIRSRFTAGSRDLLATAVPMLTVPLHWLYPLPAPKTARAVLDRLEGMDAAKILPGLALNPGKPEKCDPILLDIMSRGAWTPADRQALLASSECMHLKQVHDHPETVDRWLDAWAHPAEFGEGLRAGLREFYEVFYREEERRIAADVQRGLERAQDMASRLSPAELFEELSQGIRVDVHLSRPSLVLAPCYWCSPRIVYGDITPDQEMVLFGCRPAEASLIPGDTVPAQLLLALEALCDPTRLVILKTILAEPLTQAEISRRLRLRPPTISHHLGRLRIAGLIAFIGTGSGETRYGARLPQIQATCDALKGFLEIRSPG